MAVRVDASGDSLSRTTNLPSISSFTAMGWFRLTTDRNDWGSFIAFGNSSGVNYLVAGVDGTGTRIMMYNGSSTNTGSTNLSTGTWYHIALACAGTGTNQLILYVNGVAEVTFTVAGGAAAQKLWFMNDNDGEWIDGRCCALKVFTAALTPAEILNEMNTIRPQKADSLNSWFPLFNGSGERTKDYSGNGYDLTAGGTLTDEDPAPISWGSAIQWVLDVGGGGGGGTTFTQDCLATAVAVATLARILKASITASAQATAPATLSRSSTFYRTASATAVGVALALLGLSSACVSIAVGAATVVKTVFKTFAATAVGTATAAVRITFIRSLAATAVALASAVLVPTYSRVASAVAVGVTAIQKTVFKILGAFAGGSATLSSPGVVFSTLWRRVRMKTGLPI